MTKLSDRSQKELLLAGAARLHAKGDAAEVALECAGRHFVARRSGRGVEVLEILPDGSRVRVASGDPLAWRWTTDPTADARLA